MRSTNHSQPTPHFVTRQGFAPVLSHERSEGYLAGSRTTGNLRRRLLSSLGCLFCSWWPNALFDGQPNLNTAEKVAHRSWTSVRWVKFRVSWQYATHHRVAASDAPFLKMAPSAIPVHRYVIPRIRFGVSICSGLHLRAGRAAEGTVYAT